MFIVAVVDPEGVQGVGSASLVMPNGDPEGQILLSYPHTHDRFF